MSTTQQRPSGLDPASFDRDVRAQDNLFEHVNGGWLRDTPIPADRGRYGSFDILREQAEHDVRAIIEEQASGPAGDPDAVEAGDAKVGDLYRSFLDTDRVEALGVEPIAAALALIDGIRTPADVVRVTGQLQAEGLGGFVMPIVSTDDRDSDAYVVYLEQAGLGLPDESYYREPVHEAIRQAYPGHIARMLEAAGIPDAAAAADRVMALETRLAAAHWDNVTTRDPVKTYTNLSLAELTDLAPGVDWAGWIDALGSGSTPFARVVARQPSFLTAAGEALQQVPVTDWQAWLTWHLVHSAAPYLSSALVAENFEFYGRTLSGLDEIRERWKRGVSLVEAALGEQVGRLYVERHFPAAARERMQVLVANLIEAFRRDFDSLDWMSPQTRAQALAKLDAFTPKIGYPAQWRDYSALTIDPSDLVGNVRRAGRFEMDRNLAKIGTPIDRDEWFMTPQTVNAYYNPGMNEIVFPAAILQPPFFDARADDAVNYGGIGAVIGHEIGHGFDDQGSQFDGAGNLRDWWTDADRASFRARADALIAQFDKVEARDAPGHRVNGALTVGENIGDLGGLTIGLSAYRIACEEQPAPELDGYTGDQRFFLGWAQVWKGKAREAEAIRLLSIDPHSPTDARANVCRNLTEFHQAFEVRPGDGMWLEDADRVRIF